MSRRAIIAGGAVAVGAGAYALYKMGGVGAILPPDDAELRHTDDLYITIDGKPLNELITHEDYNDFELAIEHAPDGEQNKGANVDAPMGLAWSSSVWSVSGDTMSGFNRLKDWHNLMPKRGVIYNLQYYPKIENGEEYIGLTIKFKYKGIRQFRYVRTKPAPTLHVEFDTEEESTSKIYDFSIERNYLFNSLGIQVIPEDETEPMGIVEWYEEYNINNASIVMIHSDMWDNRNYRTFTTDATIGDIPMDAIRKSMSVLQLENSYEGIFHGYPIPRGDKLLIGITLAYETPEHVGKKFTKRVILDDKEDIKLTLNLNHIG